MKKAISLRKKTSRPQRRKALNQDELNRRDHCRILYREHILSCATFAKELLRGCFILNGAAVTAILASDKFDTLKWGTSFFTIGAFLTIVSGVFAYHYQVNIAKSWKYYITKERFEYSESKLTLSFWIGVSSLFSFWIGLWVTLAKLMS